MAEEVKQDNPPPITAALIKSVESVFSQKGNVPFSQKPDFTERDIIEYESRMRVFGLEKFNGPSFVSAVNFYLSEEAKKQEDTLGALVTYINNDCVIRLLKALGFTGILDDEDESLLNTCGELCTSIAGQLKKDVASLGYSSLVVSEPQSYRSDIPEGVDFCYTETVFHEAGFYVWKEKAFVAGVTLAPAK